MRAEQNGSDREEERERERERNSRDSSARVRHEGVGRVTGKAAGSAGVCTTDTCLDSITGLESHSFLPIKTEKTDPAAPSQVHPRKSSYFFISYSARRIGNCFEPPDAAVNHPLFASSSSFSSFSSSSGHPSCRVLKIRLRSRRTRSRTGFERVGVALTRSTALFLPLSTYIRSTVSTDARKNASKPLVETFRYLVTETINVSFNNSR